MATGTIEPICCNSPLNFFTLTVMAGITIIVLSCGCSVADMFSGQSLTVTALAVAVKLAGMQCFMVSSLMAGTAVFVIIGDSCNYYWILTLMTGIAVDGIIGIIGPARPCMFSG